MNSLTIACPSMGGHEAAVISWLDTATKPWPIVIDQRTEGDDAGFLTKCDRAWREADGKVIGYLHSDLYMLEHAWDRRVLAEFNDPNVAVVGVVGAMALGSESIYKVPYDYRQLARADVWSNLTDWSSHGRREQESREIVVVDSCAVFVRREFLDRLGGWPVERYPNTSHCSDLYICLAARRAGLRCRMVGVAAAHRSGGRGQAGTDWLNARGGDESLHRRAHAALYEEFRDVLPIRIS